MVQALSAFLDFCYIARGNVHTQATLSQMQDAIDRYHRLREIFLTSGACPNGFQLPRQHSLKHYYDLIVAFGAPNGLCSSITESKHIVAVKEPWRRSSRFNALGQMLLINQRLDKLAAARVDFTARRMLQGGCLLDTLKRLGLGEFMLCFMAALFSSSSSLALDSDQEESSDPGAEDEHTVTSPAVALSSDGAFEGPTRRAYVDMAQRAGTQVARLCLPFVNSPAHS